MRFEHNESKIIERIMADKMYEKARHVLTQDIIRPEDFIDLYGTKTVEEDIKYVKKMEEKFKQEDSPEKQELIKKSPLVLEAALFYEQIKSQ